MTFGQTIKKLRRDADMTQEDLAQLLAISPQAVSRWETDIAMPDISLLPSLANIFDVSADYLLGIDIENKEKAIAEILEKERELACEGLQTEAIETLREGLRMYPNSYKLMTALANDLYCDGHVDEALDYAMRVIDKCTDTQTKSEAIDLACSALSFKGEREKAIELAKTMPNISCDYLLCGLLEGNQLAEHYKKVALEDMTNGLLCLQKLASFTDSGYTDEERLELYTKIFKIYELLFEEDDYCFFAQFPAIQSRNIAELCVRKGEFDRAMEHIADYVKYGEMFEEYPRDAAHTSVAFRGIKYGGWIKRDPDFTYYKEMIEELSEECFKPLRGREDFQKIMEDLKIKAK